MVFLRNAKEEDFPYYFDLKSEKSDMYWMGFEKAPDREKLFRIFKGRMKTENPQIGEKRIKIIVSDEVPAGYVQCTFNEEEIELGIGISEKNQNCGIGTAALKLILQDYENDKRIIFARIRDDNLASQKIFQKNGFKPTEIVEELFYPYVNKVIPVRKYIYIKSEAI